MNFGTLNSVVLSPFSRFIVNEIAIRFLSLSEAGIIGISYLVIIAGGVLGWLTWKGEGRLRRVTYLLGSAILTFAYVFSQFIWAGAPAALAGGYIWVIFALAMGATLP